MFLGNCLIVLSRPHSWRAGSPRREVSRELLSSHTFTAHGSFAELDAEPRQLPFGELSPQRTLEGVSLQSLIHTRLRLGMNPGPTSGQRSTDQQMPFLVSGDADE